MKRIFISLSLITFSIFLLSYSSGIFVADYTGSTGLGQGCAQVGCHEGIGTMGVDTPKLSVRVLDAANNDVNSYTLNQQYTVEVKFRLDGAVKVGFQCVSLFFSSGKAGTVSNILMPANLQIYTDGSGREYVSHTAAGSGNAVMSGGYAIWKYKWTAPSTAPQAIFFHVAVNRTNNDMASTGDSILISTNKVLQLPTAYTHFDAAGEIQIFPNPCYNQLHVDASYLNIRTMRVVDLQGRIWLKINSGQDHLDVSNLPKGNYILQIESGSGQVNKLFSKE